MLDPISAAATATKAYAMVKALVEAGREAHDVMGQIGQWYGAARTCFTLRKSQEP